jgi:hypothetical protein
MAIARANIVMVSGWQFLKKNRSKPYAALCAICLLSSGWKTKNNNCAYRKINWINCASDDAPKRRRRNPPFVRSIRQSGFPEWREGI